MKDFFVKPPDFRSGRTEFSKENEGGKKVTKSKTSARRTAVPTRPNSSESAQGSSSTKKAPTVGRADNSRPESKMPLYTYAEYIPKPTVVYIKTEDEANEMVQALNGAVGFDLEWPVSFRRNGAVDHKTALVQLCDADLILLIQVSAMKNFPQKVKELIESTNVPKMGVNIRNDGMKLYRDFGILAANFIELGALAGQGDARFAAAYRRPIVSLAKVVAFYLRRTLDKGPVRTSKWDQELSKEQMAYAANDAHCALMVYKKVLSIARATKRPLSSAGYTSNLAQELSPPSVLSVLDAAPGSSATTTACDTSALGPRSQQLKAYTLWRSGHGLLAICIKLRSKANPLGEGAAITHVMKALEADPALPFAMNKLKALVQMDSSSWVRHRDRLSEWVEQGRGVDLGHV
ncbi:ribonuclease H-like protein [Artomyces pyxidatus]|uniref:Ribonuclease H-like protein n=1 Tax=Artomyces pyxidatus TaxID=48021 RepID=A0ACB8SZB0_9AGAM|nr:ribonuclease H-like protein [Artomyces pyxidatus]